MIGSFVRVALVCAFVVVAVRPAGAVFIPGVAQLSPEQVAAQDKLDFFAWTKKELIETLRTPVGGLAASFDYRNSTQDFSGMTIGPTNVSSEADLDTYTLRPEFVISNWLSVYGILARYDGKSTSNVGDVDLDGWGGGLGVTGSFGLPPVGTVIGGQRVSFAVPFVVPDFNWTSSDLEGIDNDLDVYNVTVRIGGQARTDRYSFGMYAGPTYQNGTSRLLINGLAVSSEPTEAWSAVVGGFFGIRLVGDDSAAGAEQRRIDLLRPTLLATIEGGIGNLEGVLVSLRYEYDLLGKLM